MVDSQSLSFIIIIGPCSFIYDYFGQTFHEFVLKLFCFLSKTLSLLYRAGAGVRILVI